MTTIELFLMLVRNALWQTEEELPEELSAAMAKNILRGAREQGLLGLVNDALVRNKVRMPEKQYMEMMVLLMMVKQGNERVSEGLRRLTELFAERGIDYVVVKGLAVGAYYPNPALRSAGDIDYYCDARNFPKAQEAVREAWGIEADANGSPFHVHYDYMGVTYEGHFSLTTFYNRKKDRYWQGLVDGNDKSNLNVRTLSPTMHTLYVFVHLYSHLMSLGVGLRQFCDLAVMLHACRKEIDHDRMHEILRTLGMERAFRAVGSILTDSLGMPPQDLDYELTDRDRRYAHRIFDIVKYRGNMGHYNKKSGFSGWRHNVESVGIKLAHFMKLWPLAPDYSCRWMAHELTKKIGK